MPRNTTGGKGHKARSNGVEAGAGDSFPIKQDFDEGAVEYGKVVEVFSTRHLRAQMPDGQTVSGNVRGKVLRSRCGRIAKGDVVLLGIRDYQSDVVDIIYKYSSSEAAKLSSLGHVEFEKGADEEDDPDIVFEDI